MGGGLLQLVAYGAQDVYLTGNPQITFFKVVYRRHTNFSMESIEQTFNGTPAVGSRVTCQISRNGDLIHRMYLQTTVTPTGASFAAGSYTGLNLINYVELEIGGQRIDKQYGDWMFIWNELSLPAGKRTGYKTMVGGDEITTGGSTLYIPLEFWFCRNPGLALPLIALQYHEVKVNLQFETLAQLQKTNSSVSAVALSSTALWVDYIFLDTDERRRFAQLSHEYLIEQLQFTGEETVTTGANKLKLNFNHPVKELVWVLQETDAYFGNYTVTSGSVTRTAANLCSVAKLQLNGHDRFTERAGTYFDRVQPYQHHENIPESTRGINVYSFALKPEEHQPSGTLNFSRIDSAVLNVTAAADATKARVYATNYTVLRVMSGMGGLSFSN